MTGLLVMEVGHLMGVILRIFSLLLVFVSLPALAAISPEHGVGAEALALAPGQRTRPRIACNDHGCLVVWSDSRGDMPSLMGARVDGDGLLIDPIGFVITTRAVAYALVSTGSDYLLVWCEDWNAPLISAATINTEGEIRYNPRNPIASGIEPDLAWNGSHALLVSADGNGDSQSGALLLEADGTPAGQPPSPIPGSMPSVASDGDEFLVAWHDGSRDWRVMVQTYDAEGGPRDEFVASQTVPDEYLSSIEVTSDGSRFLVILGVSNRYWLTRVFDPDGQPASEIHELRPLESDAVADPVAVWNGSQFMVLYDTTSLASGLEPADVALLTLTPEGTEAIPVRNLGSSLDERTPSLALNAGIPIAVWTERADLNPGHRGTTAVTLAVLDPSGSLTSREYISYGIACQDQPAAAAGNGINLVAWQERTGLEQTGHIFYGRLDQALQRLDGRGVPLPGSGDQKWPELAYDGTDFLVAWYEDAHVMAIGIHPDGSLASSQPVVVGEALEEVYGTRLLAVLWDGRSYVAFWPDRRGVLVASRLARTGDPIGPTPIEISTDTYAGDVDPTVAWNGEEYLVAWTSIQPWTCPVLCPSQIGVARARRLSSELIPVGVQIDLDEPGSGEPAVVAMGREFAVAWSDNEGVKTARLSDGRLVPASEIRAGGYFVPLSLVRSGTTINLLTTTASPYSLRQGVTMFDLDPKTLEPLHADFISTSGDLSSTALGLSAPDGSLVVFYVRTGSVSPLVGIDRVFARRYSPTPRRRAARSGS